MTAFGRTTPALAGAMLLAVATTALSGQQQLVDPEFHPRIERPAYSRGGPTVAIDEAHSNFHTAGGQYAPLAALLRSDGYRVLPNTQLFEPAALAAVRVLVIANARNLPAILAGDITKPALSEHECDVIATWVRGGGSLLLVADHAPFGNAADNLARRFGIRMGTGWAFDRATEGITTQLVFSRQNGLLGTHPIIRGRTSREAIATIRSFTGQSLSVPPGASVLMRLSATAREARTPDDLDAEDAAARSQDTTARAAYGTRSRPVANDAQGEALAVGRGRVVVLGEAAMLSAQILRFRSGEQHRDTRIGMNVPDTDDQQFALNVLHWLSGALK